MDIEKLVSQAISGNKTALEGVVTSIQDDIYYLSLRMLAHPEDAKDATQEILIKVITNLSTFRFQSQFKTWVFRIATNYLLTEKKLLDKDPGLTFELFKMDLERDLQDPNELKDDPEYLALLNELRISCTMAMLLCLKPAHRMAYILGDILEMEHEEASQALSISKANFRKQLSRSRATIIEFTTQSCGLVNPCAKCSCENKIIGAIERQRIKPDHLHFSNNEACSYTQAKESLLATQQSLRALSLQSSISHYKSPMELSAVIELLVSSRFKVGLSEH